MHPFDRAIDLVSTAPHHWSVHIEPRWNIGNAPNGGYLQAFTIEAMARGLEHPDPLTVTTHYISRVEAGEDAEIVVEPIKDGRSNSVAMARLLQDGREMLRTIGTFTDLDDQSGTTLQRAYPPEFPPPDDCLGGDPSAAPFEFVRQFDIRLAPDLAHSSTSEIGGWIRFREERDPDLAAMPLFADGFPPTVFSIGALGWVPTLELTVHFRAKPEPGWLQCLFTTHLIRDGHFEEDGVIWDSSGRAVAQSRQLARILDAG